MGLAFEEATALVLSKAELKFLHKILSSDGSFVELLKDSENLINVLFGVIAHAATSKRFSLPRMQLISACARKIGSSASIVTSCGKSWEFRARTVRKLVKYLRDNFKRCPGSLELNVICILRKFLTTSPRFHEAYTRRAITYFILDIMELLVSRFAGDTDGTLAGWMNVLIETLEVQRTVSLYFIFTWAGHERAFRDVFQMLICVFQSRPDLRLKTSIVWSILRSTTGEAVWKRVTSKYGFVRYRLEYEVMGVEIGCHFNQMFREQKQQITKAVGDKRHLLRLLAEEHEMRRLCELFDTIRGCQRHEHLTWVHDMTRTLLTAKSNRHRASSNKNINQFCPHSSNHRHQPHDPLQPA